MEDGRRVRIGSDQYFAAGVRLMQAAGGYDIKTRKALERLSVVYFRRAIEGLGGRSGTGSPALHASSRGAG